MRRIIFLNAAISLLIGSCFYNPLLSIYFSKVAAIRNHIPDMLWSYALVMVLFLIMEDYIIPITVISSLLGAIMEFLQLIKITPGTFDLMDILLETLAALIAAMMIIRIKGGTINEVQKNHRLNSMSRSFCRGSHSKLL